MIKKWILHPVKRRIAKYYLVLLRRFFGLKVIGITGSCGKTTTKEMLASILKLKAKTVWTHANIDPVYNIPTTILKCTPQTKYLVLEMGVEYPGEMDFYLWLAKPDIGLVTNVYPTHTEFLKDVTGVAAEKGKLIRRLGVTGVAVLNSANKFSRQMATITKAKVVWFESGKDPVKENANAAAAVAKVLQIPEKIIQKGLATYVKPESRFEIIRLKSGAAVFNDSYNSNPAAFLAALPMFLKIAKGKEKIGVFGDMLELGNLEEPEHRRIGRAVGKAGFKAVFGVGKAIKFSLEEIRKASPATKIYFFEKYEDVLRLIRPHLTKNACVFVKGSHAIGLAKLVYNL